MQIVLPEFIGAFTVLSFQFCLEFDPVARIGILKFLKKPVEEMLPDVAVCLKHRASRIFSRIVERRSADPECRLGEYRQRPIRVLGDSKRPAAIQRISSSTRRRHGREPDTFAVGTGNEIVVVLEAEP
ncbi:hypothetical protein [Rhizobium johnstonii]|uniref:hypothetical protein n=1 Tax=Rhizobium johnstonii TaxID=3019933 RepID=UPI003F95F789